MNNEETRAITEELGGLLGETIVIFTVIVNALRKQPGFDEDRFCQEIQQAILSRDDWSGVQRDVLSSLLDDTK
jgi:hypothetical protein